MQRMPLSLHLHNYLLMSFKLMGQLSSLPFFFLILASFFIQLIL